MSYDLGTAHGKIVLEYNGDKDVDKAERDIDRLSKKSKESDGHLKKLGKTLGALGKGVALTGLVGSLTNAAVQAAAIGIQILGIVPALVSVLSLSSALPGIYVSLIGTVLILKAAFAGVSDAVKAAFGDDPAKFEEALKKLSPEARAFAIELKKIVPFFKEIQQGIQNAFFGNGFQELFPALVTGARRLQPMLNLIAEEFGAIAYEIGTFATSVGSINFVEEALTRFLQSLENIRPAFKPIMNGLRDVGFVGLPLMNRLSLAVGAVGEKFGYWLQDISADGRLEAWIDTAINTLKELGAIVKNVGSILNSVFKAAAQTGGGLLGTLAEITGQFAAFLKSAEGNAAITSLFSGIMSIAKQLAPIFTTLAGALAKALGPALQRIATGVGPELLKVVQALAPAFGPLAMGVADLMSAIAPLLPPLAQLVALIATSLGNGLSILAAELAPVIQMFGTTFLSALQKLTPVLGEMLRIATPLAAKFGVELAAALGPLVPVILDLADAFVKAILPVLPQLMSAASQLIPPIIALAASLGGSLATSLRAIIPILPILVAGFAAIVTTTANTIAFFIRLATAANNLTQRITSAAGLIIYWIRQIPTVIGSAIGAAIATLVRFAPRAGAALAALPSVIARGILAAMNILRSLFTAGVNAAVSTASQLPRRAASAINALASLLAGVARSAWNSLRSVFTSGVNSAVAVARTIGGRVRGAVGNLGGILSSAGRALIQGLINGISSGISRVMNMVSGLASRVRSAFSSALSIFSPSKVFFKFGVNIDQGLINGIKSKLQDVVKTATMLSKAVIRPSVVASREGMPYGAASALSRIAPPTNEAGADRPQSFGPYELVLDGGVVASFVVDTITGNPTVVAKASSEGSRKRSFSGSGRVTASA